MPVGAYVADHTQPLAHYWMAASHNTYVVGDQLTGEATAAAYCRQQSGASTRTRARLTLALRETLSTKSTSM